MIKKQIPVSPIHKKDIPLEATTHAQVASLPGLKKGGGPFREKIYEFSHLT
jgi:hypothetical protein